MNSATSPAVTAVDFDPFAGGDILLTTPATDAQKEIWASVQMGDAANCAYNESQSLRLRGDLAVSALQAAIQTLIQRHELLRATVSPDGTMLCISDFLEIDIPCQDLSELSLADRNETIANRRKQAVETPFDLEHGPLLRVELLKLQPQEHLLIVTAHHIICDGWSWAVLMTDLGTLYSARKQTRETDLVDPDQFDDYALTLEQQANSQEANATVAYWLDQFAGPIPVLDLPTDRPRPPLRTFNSDREDWQLPPQLVTELKQLGKQSGCSFMSIMLAGFEVWLHRLTGQTDLVVGVLAAGQAATGMTNLVGHCVNLLPMRSQVKSQQSFSEYLIERRSAILDAYDHQQFTFGSLVGKLTIPRDASRIPLVPVLLNIDQGLDNRQLRFDGVSAELFSNPRTYENFELFVNATELNGAVTLECQYNTNLFDSETIQRRMAELETILTGIIENPTQPIGKLPFLPLSEQKLLSDWNRTYTSYPQDQCIHQLFETQVQRTPSSIAIQLDNQSLTYQELDHRANQLAAYLQTQGAQPETLVGISLERTPDMLVAILAVLKAGAAYVPLDPTYPQERLAFMVTDSQMALLITQSHLVAALPTTQLQVIDLDRDQTAIAKQSNTPLLKVPQPHHLAYVIYTSGSTGQPKGVQVTHQSVVNFLTAMQQKPGIKAGDRLLSVTTLSFDIAVLELLLPLTMGATTVLLSRAVAMDGEALANTINHADITVMQATPATWRLLLASGWQGSPQLKILCGGEALSTALAQELVQRAQQVWNLYGPTETTIWSTCYEILPTDPQSWIGQPIANTQIYLLDSQHQPVPIGVPGELYIGGAGVARGYLNRPELTAERFIANPFSPDPQPKLYRTGDIARYRSDGNLEYCQRIDDQVKVRGFRIELGEIETTLAQHPAIKQAIVVAWAAEAAAEKTLVGYWVPTTANQADLIPQLRQFLQRKLPDHMIPTTFMQLEQIPLTPNGKIDRQALPQPDATRQVLSDYIAPRTPVEQQIAEIWARVLKLDRVGVNDNFFELGGYSLLAIQIVSRLRPLLQIDLSLPVLFELPTVSTLAERVETLRWAMQGAQVSHLNSASANTDDYEEGDL